MARNGHNPHLMRWKFGNKTSSEKMPLMNGDIDRWRKRVETASEFAVSEVFSLKKPHIGSPDLAMPLQSSAQLKDHDEAYSEAQALLGDWLHSKLRVELEMDEDDPIFPAEKGSLVALDICAASSCTNFDDFYSCLTEEEESSTISNFLQELMEQEVLDSAMMDQLAMDVGQTRKKFRNPAITMEARHKQVRENKARREAEKQRHQRARDTLEEAREEARKRARELELKRKHQARRQEDMIQQEMVKLRRQIEEQRCAQQLARQRERECMERPVAKNLQCGPQIPTLCQKRDQHQLHIEQQVQTLFYMHNLKCLQRHFTGWFSVVLNQRIRMGKAKTVCEWRRKLSVWRAWRAQVLLKQQQREVERTEEELRAENRRHLLAVQSDKRRLLRRFLNEWQVWTKMERDQQAFFCQKQETHRKMAALISAATSGQLWATQAPSCLVVKALTDTAIQTETEHKEVHQSFHSIASATSLIHQDKNPGASKAPVTLPTEPWQISRQHVAPTGDEIRRALQKDRALSSLKNLSTPGARFEHRHTTQQQIISQQRKLLKEQQDQIVQLRRSSIAPEVSGQPDPACSSQKRTVTQQTCSHPIIAAMEARAQQRAERRKQVEEIKRRKEDEKLAEMKAAEEQRQREEEEEKRRAAERRREERRLEKEREEEKQRQLRRQRELTSLASQHYHRTLLRRQGLAPWKRLVQLTQANMQILDWQMIQEERAERFYRVRTLRRVLKALQNFVTQKKLLEWERQEVAEKHNSRRVLQRWFLAWRQLPVLLRIEREKEQRREKLMRKVVEILPDFCVHPS
ncbi:hypothetical protein WMY93_030765 [Mugilogobius chulae]|uniref:Coiled-coil domain containing 191 n=1 Tax=Mugilogobius chulae TaxID=88201 RepID=A0AAW0MIR1_9GOBI